MSNLTIDWNVIIPFEMSPEAIQARVENKQSLTLSELTGVEQSNEFRLTDTFDQTSGEKLKVGEIDYPARQLFDVALYEHNGIMILGRFQRVQKI